MNLLDYETIFDYRGESYNSACDKYPTARHCERQALIDLLDVHDHHTIIDAPAGGGYLAEGIREAFGPTLSMTCIEPAKNFSQTIPSCFAVINSPIDNIPLKSQSIDSVASLAGLHHIEDRTAVFREWSRLLKAGGQLAVADVATGSGPDEFLNVFVDRYTPQGHKGIFISDHEFATHFENSGLELQHDRVTQVPWLFDNHQDMADFCIKLFYLLDVNPDEVLEQLQACVGIKSFANDKVGIEWELRYACAIKN
jgi:ubiquinone/menaquinone biosynthesis C-methylase UbiE